VLILLSMILVAVIAFLPTMKEGNLNMKLPKLTPLDSSRSMISAFRGYDHRLVIPEGSFYDENNLASDNYPVLSVRKPHGIYKTHNAEIRALTVNGAICSVVGNTVYIGDETVALGGMGTVKQMECMGVYLILLDEKGDTYYINTQNLSEKGTLAHRYVAPPGKGYSCACYITDESGKSPYLDEPEFPLVGDLWINNTPNGDGLLARWSGEKWVHVSTVYTALFCDQPFDGFSKGEVVTVDTFEMDNPSFTSVKDAPRTIIAIPDNHTLVLDYTPPYHSKYESVGLVSSSLEVTRSVPVLDYICVSGNRLWGCRYGEQNGVFVNEIYASRLGDPKTFYLFNGTAEDSYTVGVGTNAPFTGAVTYQGNPIFFKETVMHRIAGYMPSNFQVQTTECHGVKDGSYRSLANVEQILFYHSTNGVYAYDGSLPRLVSENFGSVSYADGVGGAFGAKYYLCLKDKNGVYATFVYDLAAGIWHRQDEGRQITGFTATDEELYYSCGKTIHTMFGSGDADKMKVSWYAETGIIGVESPDHKYLSRLTLRMSLAFGSMLMIFIEYDSKPEWLSVATISGYDLSSFSLPVKVERCDHFRIRFEGVGDCKIYSITKTMERGSEV